MPLTSLKVGNTYRIARINFSRFHELVSEGDIFEVIEVSPTRYVVVFPEITPEWARTGLSQRIRIEWLRDRDIVVEEGAKLRATMTITTKPL